MKILNIKSSILGDYSTSEKVSNLLMQNLNGDKINLDLSKENIPWFSGKILNDLTSGIVSEEVKKYNELIQQIKEVDILIINAPMYNFAIPSSLKNYFDAIIRAKETFHYNEKGEPVGHLKNIKKAYVIITRGGFYLNNKMTFQEDYIKCTLGFIGINDVEFIIVEGLATGEENKERAIQKAKDEIKKLTSH